MNIGQMYKHKNGRDVAAYVQLKVERPDDCAEYHVLWINIGSERHRVITHDSIIVKRKDLVNWKSIEARF